MSDHHTRCKSHNFISVGFSPDECPYCRIEVLTERLASLGKEHNDYVIQSVKNDLFLTAKVDSSIQLIVEVEEEYNSKSNKLIERHAEQCTVLRNEVDKAVKREIKYREALQQIAKQPLEPAHIYEIADRIKLIAKVALEI